MRNKKIEPKSRPAAATTEYILSATPIRLRQRNRPPDPILHRRRRHRHLRDSSHRPPGRKTPPPCFHPPAPLALARDRHGPRVSSCRRSSPGLSRAGKLVIDREACLGSSPAALDDRHHLPAVDRQQDRSRPSLARFAIKLAVATWDFHLRGSLTVPLATAPLVEVPPCRANRSLTAFPDVLRPPRPPALVVGFPCYGEITPNRPEWAGRHQRALDFYPPRSAILQLSAANNSL